MSTTRSSLEEGHIEVSVSGPETSLLQRTALVKHRDLSQAGKRDGVSFLGKSVGFKRQNLSAFGFARRCYVQRFTVEIGQSTLLW